MPVTFTPGIGRLATDRYDFENHIQGIAFRHNANQIDVSPPVNIQNISYSTVDTALTAIGAYILFASSLGQGFTTIGDGYDTFANSDISPSAPYDSSVPPLDPVLDDLLNNTSNPLHHRVRSGGIVVIKAGTYKFTGSVNVPPGIIIMGEGFGTKIINHTDDLADPPDPSIPNPIAPLFIIKADFNRSSTDDGVDSTERFMFTRETMLVNLTIADNFVEPRFLGDLSYKNPRNNDSLTPLVSLEEGASLTCDNVRFLGKTVYTLGVISNITSFAIKTDSTTPLASGTILKVKNCFIDGFSIPVQFTASGGLNDQFIFSNNLVRGYGFLNSDFVSPANNTILKLNASNIVVSENYCFGYDDTVTSLAYITPPVSPPVLQSQTKILISSNNIAIKRPSNAVNSTFQLVRFSTPVSGDLSIIAFGNNFNGVIQLDGGIRSKIRTIASSYTVDAISKDYVILVDTTSSAITVNLPPHEEGRTLVIKDKAGFASLNNITLVRTSGNFEGVAVDPIITGNWVSWTILSDGQDWYIV